MDTTTGISAPPMEATKCQPNARAIRVIRMRMKPLPSTDTNTSIRIKDKTNAARLSLCLAGSCSGALLILPLSLPNATSEPVKVTAPMKMPK